MWTFSGGFRTWVKMSLVMTSGKNDDAVEFRQEVFMSKEGRLCMFINHNALMMK